MIDLIERKNVKIKEVESIEKSKIVRIFEMKCIFRYLKIIQINDVFLNHHFQKLTLPIESAK